MRLLISIMIIVLISCNLKENKQNDNSAINIDSIEYSKIQDTREFWRFSKFILKYPESEFFNSALDKYHRTREEFYDSLGGMPIIDCFRNCVGIQIKTNQKIVYEHELIKKKDLQDSLLAFFINANNEEYKPSMRYTKDLNDSLREISNGHIQLEYINDSCAILKFVVKEIHNSINLYKSHLSRDWYQTEIANLEKAKKNHLDSLLDNRLVIFGYDKIYAVPKPPPPPSP